MPQSTDHDIASEHQPRPDLNGREFWSHRTAGSRTPGSQPDSGPPATRGPGYLLAILRTRKGPQVESPAGVLRSAASGGALAGLTANGQPADPGVKVAEAGAVARLRSAAFARKRAGEAVGDLRAVRLAKTAIADADRELNRVGRLVKKLESEVRSLERRVVSLAGEVGDPSRRPVPDRSEWGEIVDDAVTGYRVPFMAKAALSVASAVVESIFTGTYIATVATVGIPGLPVEVELGLPWVAGSAIGALIPALAQRAAHAAADADADAPWYVRHGATIAVVVPAMLGVGRAVAMTEERPISGVLGLGLALLLTSLAVVGAAIGHREAEGRVHDQRRSARDGLRDELLTALTPGPSPQALELRATEVLLHTESARLGALLERLEAIRTSRRAAEEARSEADANLRVIYASSSLEAEEEGALAVVSTATFVQRRDAVSAVRNAQRPPAFDASEWPSTVSGLPRLRASDLTEPELSDRQDGEESDEGENGA